MKRMPLLAALLGLALSTPAMAFDGVYAFGDSLSDNGNIYAATYGLFPPAPYYQGRFSNGPVMVEDLAKGLGVSLHDYAWGGATSGSTNVLNNNYGLSGLPGLSQEISSYVGSNSLDPNGLYTVWAGADDALALFANLSPTSTLTQIEASAAQTIATSTTNVTDAVNTLASHGAQHILVLNMPDLGLTPRALTDNSTVTPYASTAATLYSQDFNQTLGTRLSTLQSSAGFSANIIQFNVFGAMNQVFANAASYGFTNLTQGCLYSTACVSSSAVQDTYAFWDDVHPTAHLHQILANEVLAAVPEPAEWLMLLAGLGLLMAWGRGRGAGQGKRAAG